MKLLKISIAFLIVCSITFTITIYSDQNNPIDAKLDQLPESKMATIVGGWEEGCFKAKCIDLCVDVGAGDGSHALWKGDAFFVQRQCDIKVTATPWSKIWKKHAGHVGQKNYPEPDFIAEIWYDLFESYWHQDVIEQITYTGKKQEKPVEMEKQITCLDIVNGSEEQ